MLVMLIGHPFAERDKVSLQELGSQTLAPPSGDECPGYLAQIEDLLDRYQVRPAQRRSLRHWNTAVSFAATGHAVALCPLTMVHTAVAVAVVPIAEEDAELVTWLLHRAGEPSSAVSVVPDVAAEICDGSRLDVEAAAVA